MNSIVRRSGFIWVILVVGMYATQEFVKAKPKKGISAGRIKENIMQRCVDCAPMSAYIVEKVGSLQGEVVQLMKAAEEERDKTKLLKMDERMQEIYYFFQTTHDTLLAISK